VLTGISFGQAGKDGTTGLLHQIAKLARRGIDLFFSHFFSEAKRNARKESAWSVEVIPLTKWLKMAPPSLKRPNSQVCRNLLGFGR
jgi:hypothetical protein